MKHVLAAGIVAALASTFAASSPAQAACGGWFQPACPAPRVAPSRSVPAPVLRNNANNLVNRNGSGIVAQGGGNLVGNRLITNDGGSLINNGGSTMRR